MVLVGFLLFVLDFPYNLHLQGLSPPSDSSSRSSCLYVKPHDTCVPLQWTLEQSQAQLRHYCNSVVARPQCA